MNQHSLVAAIPCCYDQGCFVPLRTAPYQMDEFCPILTFPMTVAFGATKLPEPILGLTSFKVVQARLGVTVQQTCPEHNQKGIHKNTR